MDKGSPQYHPPPPSYAASMPPNPPEQVIITQHVVSYGPESQLITCPHCSVQMLTEVKSEATTKTHMVALILFCCLCWPCAWIPYCCASCQNRVHYCSACGKFLGTYHN